MPHGCCCMMKLVFPAENKKENVDNTCCLPCQGKYLNLKIFIRTVSTPWQQSITWAKNSRKKDSDLEFSSLNWVQVLHSILSSVLNASTLKSKVNKQWNHYQACESPQEKTNLKKISNSTIYSRNDLPSKKRVVRTLNWNVYSCRGSRAQSMADPGGSTAL